MRLFSRTQFLDRLHFLLHIRPIAAAGRHRADTLMLLFDIVKEVRVIRPPQESSVDLDVAGL